MKIEFPLFIAHEHNGDVRGLNGDVALCLFTSPEAFHRYAEGREEIATFHAIDAERFESIRQCWYSHDNRLCAIDPVDDAAPRLPLDSIEC